MTSITSYWTGWPLTPPGAKPHQGGAIRAHERARQRYRDQRACLDLLATRFPGLAYGEPAISLSTAQVDGLFTELTQGLSGQPLRHRHNFLVRGLERGCRELGWEIEVPAPIVTVPRESPVAVNADFIRLQQLDRLIDLHETAGLIRPPSGLETPAWSAGRLLFALITEGSVLQRKLLERLPDALCRGVGMDGHRPYLTLQEVIEDELEREDAPPDTEHDHTDETQGDTDKRRRKSEKTKHTAYRRIFPGPISALLLLRYYQQHGKAWPDDGLQDPTPLSVDSCLRCYCQSLVEASSLPNGLVAFLLETSRTAAKLTFTPYLANYAAHDGIGVSLPPSVWRRLTTKKAPFDLDRVTADSARPPSHSEDDIHLLGTLTLPESRQYTDQAKRLVDLNACLGPTQGATSFSRQKIKENLQELITLVQGESPILQLVSGWTLHLLTHGGRVKPRLEISTIKKYLSTVAQDLVRLACTHTSLGDWSSEDWETLYEAVLQRAKGHGNRMDRLGRLHDFHRYLESRYDVPPVVLEHGKGRTRRVDANLLTPAEFIRARDVIRASGQDDRLLLMQELVLVIGYRCGLRRSEVASLTLKDLQGVEDPSILEPELLVRPNTHASGKTASATRRLPLHILLSQEERAQLALWKGRRHTEQVGGNDLHHLLFCLPGLPHERIEDALLFGPIHHAMRIVSGDPTLRFHHLRHTFVTLMLLRMTSSGSGSLLPREWATDDEGRIALPCWNEDLSALAMLAPQPEATRKRLWALGLWTGHLTPDETLATYTHLIEMQLRHEVWTTQDTLLSTPLQQSLMGRSATAVAVWRHKWRKKVGEQEELTASRLCEALSEEWTPFLEPSDDGLVWLSYSASHVPQRKLSPHHHLSASTVYSTLNFIELETANGQSMTAALAIASRRLQLPAEMLSRWVEEGQRLMALKTSRGKPRFSDIARRTPLPQSAHALEKHPMPELSTCLAPPYVPSHQREANRSFRALLDWYDEAPDACLAAITPILKAMQRTDAQIKVRSEETLVSIMPFFERLGLSRYLRLTVEIADSATESHDRTYWRRCLRVPDRSIQIKVKENGKPTRHPHGNANVMLADWNKPLRKQKKAPTKKKQTSQDLHDFGIWTAVRFALFTALVVIQPERKEGFLPSLHEEPGHCAETP
ncbi:hypothetical protein [Halomonas sp. 25-S5]|uniref:hypothetical protein n=1 Tax=Halomonas sp. 25-S5 TaxID=2994065 RepID=UPI0024683107|nr:hypothetical protein [Halomonas sp. 25-S5]